MRTHDEVEIIFVQEIRDDVGAENVGHAAVGIGPPPQIWLRVGPEQVAEKAFVWHWRRALNAADLVHILQASNQME